MKLNKFIKNYNFKEVDSTSLILRNNIDNIKNFTFVSAEYQTAGKGRVGHTWESEKGQNLLFSFVIKDKKILKYKNIFTIILGGILLSYFQNRYNLNFSIKWPNDIYVNNKKFVGIITESVSNSAVIVGIGINVNQADFNCENATSLSIELNEYIYLNELKKSLYKWIKKYMYNIGLYKDDIILLINKFNYLKDKQISFQQNNKNYSGKVKAISEDGTLIIEYNNQQIKLNSGEVSIVRTQQDQLKN